MPSVKKAIEEAVEGWFGKGDRFKSVPSQDRGKINLSPFLSYSSKVAFAFQPVFAV